MLQLSENRKTVTPSFIKFGRSLGLPDIFPAFQGLPCPMLLDSALLYQSLGRFSYLTADPFLVLRSKGGAIEIESQGVVERLESNPFQVFQDLLKGFGLLSVPGLPPFQGGVIGYLSYELGHHLERLPHCAKDDLNLPEINIGFYDWVIARDCITGSTWAIATGLPDGSTEKAHERLLWIEDRIKKASLLSSSKVSPKPLNITSNFSREGYINAVKVVKEYITQGEVYQVNISQRFETYVACQPWELYLRLREVNPAPFSAYLQFPEVTVLSASPEEFLHLEDGIVHSRPMKGTRPRGRTPAEDQALAAELLASEKDRAENVMIVDLIRNDLGRVCIPGSIEVPELFAIEKYPTVFQMVSTVKGRLRPDLDAVDLLKASFPGGSVTGAPKIRAMEIIDEIEPTQRSVYCGAVGYIGFDSSMLTSIPIRILLAKGQKVYFQVGGGIVYDSDPQAEYEETLHKAKGSLLALGIYE